MRSQEELERAHDILTGILDGVVELSAPMDAPAVRALEAMADVLCWALDHENERSRSFAACVRAAQDVIDGARRGRARVLPFRPRQASG